MWSAALTVSAEGQLNGDVLAEIVKRGGELLFFECLGSGFECLHKFTKEILQKCTGYCP